MARTVRRARCCDRQAGPRSAMRLLRSAMSRGGSRRVILRRRAAWKAGRVDKSLPDEPQAESGEAAEHSARPAGRALPRLSARSRPPRGQVRQLPASAWPVHHGSQRSTVAAMSSNPRAGSADRLDTAAVDRATGSDPDAIVRRLGRAPPGARRPRSERERIPVGRSRISATGARRPPAGTSSGAQATEHYQVRERPSQALTVPRR